MNQRVQTSLPTVQNIIYCGFLIMLQMYKLKDQPVSYKQSCRSQPKSILTSGTYSIPSSLPVGCTLPYLDDALSLEL